MSEIYTFSASKSTDIEFIEALKIRCMKERRIFSRVVMDALRAQEEENVERDRPQSEEG